MAFSLFRLNLCVVTVAALMMARPAPAQEAASPEALLAAAERLMAEAETAEAADRRSKYEEALRQLDEIIVSYPESDLAVKILLDEKVGSVDPLAIRTFLESSPGETSPPEPAPAAQPAVTPTALAASAITQCFDAKPDSGSVTFRIDLDESGALTSRPILVAPERPGPAERRLFRLGLAAIEDCAPYTMIAGSPGVEVTFDPSGVSVSGGAFAQPAVSARANAASAPEAALSRNPVAQAQPGRALAPPTAAPVAPLSATPAAPNRESVPPATTAPFPVQDAASIAPLEADEASLALDRSARREIQRRLSLLGFDTRGVDGVFGKGTRGAVETWQRSLALPATGYLDARHLAMLRSQSTAVYDKWRADSERSRRSSQTGGGGASGRYLDSRGCLRERGGRAVPGFKSRCK